MKFIGRSPTRVDLAGGTLDCWPLYLLTEGAETTNLAVSIFTTAEITAREDLAIDLEIVDLGYRRTFSSLSEVLNSTDREIDLVKAHLRFWQPKMGFRLRTQSESPVGGGLGGSSSLCISLIKAFSKWSDARLNTYEQVELAHNLEAEVLKKPTGTQDYFPAIEPGLNIIRYTAQGPKTERLNLDGAPFDEKMILVYTGQPHHSGLNNWQVIKAAIEGDQKTLEALHEIKRVASETARVCRARQWQDLPELFRQELRARVRLSTGFSSPEIEQLTKLVLSAGAEAVKICGAGGGGCVIVWSPVEQREAVVQQCQKSGFKVLSAKPVVE